MRFYIFEGTTEEFRQIEPLLKNKENVMETKPALLEDVVGDADARAVTVEEAKEILTRRELSEPMLNMLRALYRAGKKRLTTDELKKVNGHSQDQFRGMVGAFGRRVSHTVPKDVYFLDQKWNGAAGHFTWTLTESGRQAMHELKMV